MTLDSSALKALTNRIAILERRNRRLARGVVALGLLAAAVATTAQVAPRAAVSSTRFTLVDDQQRVRALLENWTLARFGGNPILTFYGDDGRAMVRLGLSERGPILEVIDKDGKVRDHFAGPMARPATQ